MRVDLVRNRLEDSVADFADRVEGAAELSALMGRNERPQVTPAAFVLPLGFDAGPQEDATSVHQQIVTEHIGVIIVVDHAGDASGAAALPELSGLVNRAVLAVTGWTPEGEDWPFALRRGRLVDAREGTLIYQLEFSITSLLRIT